MKVRSYNAYESVTVRCPKCKTDKLTVIFDENYCECGVTLRLICRKCNEEMDFGLTKEPKFYESWLRKQQDLSLSGDSDN